MAHRGKKGDKGDKGDRGDKGDGGSRGAGMFSAEVSSRGWQDYRANLATPNNNVIGDVVTLVDAAGGWAETRAWSGRAWVRVEHVIDGNTVIPGTLLANAIATDQIEARHLKADQAVISSGLQLGGGIITFGHLDNNLIGGIAQGARFRISVSGGTSARTYRGSVKVLPRVAGTSEIVVRRDSANEVMRYSADLVNISFTPSKVWKVIRTRTSQDDERSGRFAALHKVYLRIEIRLDSTVIATKSLTFTDNSL